MNIAALLADRARGAGDRLAIVERRGRITFAGLDRAAASAAADLRRAGVRPGMRALVLSPMSIALYTVVIALFRLRATAVFVDPSAGRERLNRCVARVAPHAFVGVPRAHVLRAVCGSVRRIPIKAAIGGGIPGTAAVARRVSNDMAGIEPCDTDTPAIVTFTSGSTGEPKAAVRTHGFLLAQHRALEESLELAPGDVDLCTLPIFLLANLASGVTSVIADADLSTPGAIDPAPVHAQIRTMRPTRVVASPAFLARLIEGPGSQTLDSFRRVYTGGAPVFPGLLERLAAAAPLASVVAVYGSTEAEPIARLDRREIRPADRAAMSRGAGLPAGIPERSIRLRILPDRWGAPLGPWTPAELERAALPPGRTGEIVVSGEHVLAGYLDGMGDDETKIRTGDRVWHRTGDAGYLDASGRLWLLGRCSAKAQDASGVTYPFAVECAASEVPGVRRSAFVLHRGARVLAAEVDGDARAVRHELMGRLGWARLADVVIVPRVPVDGRHNAKVEYPALVRVLDRARGRTHRS